MGVWKERVLRFLFRSESDRWLAILRVGMGLQVLIYACSFLKDWTYLFGMSPGSLGLRRLSETLLSLESRLIPRLGWLIDAGGYFGLSENTVLYLAWFCLLCAGGGLLIGLASRFWAIIAWFLHLSAAKSGGSISYGVDNFMTIGLFYLMLSPLPDRYSLDRRWRNRRPKQPQLLGFYRHVLQLHLSVIYFFSGLTKALGSGWWDGSNVWRALIRPPFNNVPPEILVRLQWFFPIAGISICLLELGYPVFMWMKRTRLPWLTAVVVMHVAIASTLGMYLFGLIMVVLNAAAFWPDSFPRTTEQPATSDRAAPPS